MKRLCLWMFAAALAFAGCSDDDETTVSRPSQADLKASAEYADGTATVTIVPEDKNAGYLMDVVRAEKVTSDTDYAAMLVAKARQEAADAGVELKDVLLRGDHTETVTGLEEDTAYWIFAAYVNGEGRVGRIVKESLLTSETGGPAEDPVFRLSVKDVKATTATFGVEVENWDGYWFVNPFDTNDPAEIADMVNEFIPNYADQMGVSIAQLLEEICFKGNQEINMSGLEPATTYYAAVMGIDTDGTVATDVVVTENSFTTEELVLSDLDFEISVSGINVAEGKATINVKPSDASVRYFVYPFDQADIDEVGAANLDAYMLQFMPFFWQQIYQQMGGQYPMEEIMAAYTYTGNSSEEWSGFKNGDKICIVACAVDAEGNPASKARTHSFTFSESGNPDPDPDPDPSGVTFESWLGKWDVKGKLPTGPMLRSVM